MFDNIKKIQKILRVCDNPYMFFEGKDLIIIDNNAKWVIYNAKTKTVKEIFSIYNGGLK